MKYNRRRTNSIFLCVILCVGALFGIREYAQQTDIKTISMKNAIADYDYMWEVLEGNYPFLKLAERKYGLSMDVLKTEYRNKIETLGKQREDFCDYYELMQECIGKFRQLAHLSIYSPYTYRNRIAAEADFKQTNSFGDLLQWTFQLYNDPIVKKRYDYLMEKYDVGLMTQNMEESQNLTFFNIGEEIAYVKIRSFNISHIQKDKDKLAEWFTENANKKYIIIDITGNGGGSDNYWAKSIVAPNIDVELGYTSYYITPYGKESREQFALDNTYIDDLNPNLEDLMNLPNINEEDLSEANYYNTVSISISPVSGNKICDGKFFLLVDDGVYSAADGFAMFCKATGFATVVGKNTKGDGGGRNVYHAKLPRSGLIIQFRAMHGLNPDGSSNVEFGTTPDVTYLELMVSQNVSTLGLCLDYINSLED